MAAILARRAEGAKDAQQLALTAGVLQVETIRLVFFSLQRTKDTKQQLADISIKRSQLKIAGQCRHQHFVEYT